MTGRQSLLSIERNLRIGRRRGGHTTIGAQWVTGTDARP